MIYMVFRILMMNCRVQEKAIISERDFFAFLVTVQDGK